MVENFYLNHQENFITCYQSRIVTTREEKIIACMEVTTNYVVNVLGLDFESACNFFFDMEIGHALAHPGPGKFLILQDLSYSEGRLYPFYRILDSENYTKKELAGYINAAGDNKSEADLVLLDCL